MTYDDFVPIEHNCCPKESKECNQALVDMNCPNSTNNDGSTSIGRKIYSESGSSSEDDDSYQSQPVELRKVVAERDEVVSRAISATSNDINTENKLQDHVNHTAASLSKTTNDSDPQSPYCYNKALDDEIRSRLDKLNTLSDLINSLETQFDEANSKFREILKHSTDRLSSLAKTLGRKSIKYGRIYHASRLSVEQSQSECQIACVEFEKANKDHQIAKDAIKNAELKLMEISKTAERDIDCIIAEIRDLSFDKLKLIDNLEDVNLAQQDSEPKRKVQNCDTIDGTDISHASDSNGTAHSYEEVNLENPSLSPRLNAQEDYPNQCRAHQTNDCTISNTAQLSEELNQAIFRLAEAESNRCQSQKRHLNRANKLMLDQENILKLERDYGSYIKRSQMYFDEARQFDAKLNSVKGEIRRISDDILMAKQAYAQTLSELEQFSEELHLTVAQRTVSMDRLG